MSFGKNPHVAKAEAAEQKARSAQDSAASAMAWRDAARQWDRAAERETDAAKRDAYSLRAETARNHADHPSDVEGASENGSARDPSMLN
jgi:hypothetical protein